MSQNSTGRYNVRSDFSNIDKSLRQTQQVIMNSRLLLSKTPQNQIKVGKLLRFSPTQHHINLKINCHLYLEDNNIKKYNTLSAANFNGQTDVVFNQQDIKETKFQKLQSKQNLQTKRPLGLSRQYSFSDLQTQNQNNKIQIKTIKTQQSEKSQDQYYKTINPTSRTKDSRNSQNDTIRKRLYFVENQSNSKTHASNKSDQSLNLTKKDKTEVKSQVQEAKIKQLKQNMLNYLSKDRFDRSKRIQKPVKTNSKNVMKNPKIVLKKFIKSQQESKNKQTEISDYQRFKINLDQCSENKSKQELSNKIQDNCPSKYKYLLKNRFPQYTRRQVSPSLLNTQEIQCLKFRKEVQNDLLTNFHQMVDSNKGIHQYLNSEQLYLLYRKYRIQNIPQHKWPIMALQEVRGFNKKL